MNNDEFAILEKRDIIKLRISEFNYPDGYKEYVISEFYENKNNNGRGGRKGNKAGDVSVRDIERKVIRVKRDIRRLALLNRLHRMMTLTFRENIVDHELSDKLFKAFVKEFNRLYPNYQFKYIGTRERQERGAIHYHLLISRYIPQKLLYEVWNKVAVGSVHMKYVGMKGIFYVVKYIEKNIVTESFISRDGFNAKQYLCSKFLDRNIKNIRKQYVYVLSRDKSYLSNNFNQGLKSAEKHIKDLNREIAEAYYNSQVVYDESGAFEIDGNDCYFRVILIKPKWDDFIC